MNLLRMRSQRGSALVAAIFLIVVVAGMVAFATRSGMQQQHLANLALLELKADAAAYTALEFASNRLNGGATTCPANITIPATAPGMDGPFTVALTCANVIGNNVYNVTATATYSAFGSPDRVRRIRTRRVSRIGAGSW